MGGGLEYTVHYARSLLFDGLPEERMGRLQDVMDIRLSASSMRTLEAGKRVWRVVAERYGWETIIGTDTGGARRSWPFWCSTCWTKRRLLTDQSPSTCGGCGGTWCFIDKQIRSRECGTGGNSCPRYKSSGTAAGAPYGGDPPHSRGY